MFTRKKMRDKNFMPPIGQAIPLGIQHVLAMFVSNFTPAIIIAGAAGFGFGTPGMGEMIYLIQLSILFAGIATLIQTIGIGPIGAKLPIVQGTSFAFLPIMIPLVAGKGVDAMAIITGGVIVGGVVQFFLGTVIKKMRGWLPPLVTGLIVLMIGLSLVKVGIQFAAGGVPAMKSGAAEFGSLLNWSMAFLVIFVTLGLKFFTKGMLSTAAVLIGLIAGYIYAIVLGEVNFGNIGKAANFMIPDPLHFGVEFNAAAIIGFVLMSGILAIEAVGDVSGITKGGAGREATDQEIAGATYANGLGSALAGLFGGLPNTSFSQNVGLIAMTGMMSRHIVTIGAIVLIFCGLVPKIGAAISTVPIEVLGGGIIVMFGMVSSAGISMLSDVAWNRRSMLIFAVALSLGLGLQLVPEGVQHLPSTVKILMTSGLLPAALIAIILNKVLPEEMDD